MAFQRGKHFYTPIDWTQQFLVKTVCAHHGNSDLWNSFLAGITRPQAESVDFIGNLHLRVGPRFADQTFGMVATEDPNQFQWMVRELFENPNQDIEHPAPMRHKVPMYTAEQKQGFSKSQSTTLLSIHAQIHPRLFTPQYSRAPFLGVLFPMVPGYVLLNRIMKYDGGTLRRPFDDPTEFQTRGIHYNSLAVLSHLPKLQGTEGQYSEVMARLRWHDPSSPRDYNTPPAILLYLPRNTDIRDLFEGVLVGLIRAFDLRLCIKHKFGVDKEVPLVIYAPSADSQQEILTGYYFYRKQHNFNFFDFIKEIQKNYQCLRDHNVEDIFIDNDYYKKLFTTLNIQEILAGDETEPLIQYLKRTQVNLCALQWYAETLYALKNQLQEHSELYPRFPTEHPGNMFFIPGQTERSEWRMAKYILESDFPGFWGAKINTTPRKILNSLSQEEFYDFICSLGKSQNYLMVQMIFQEWYDEKTKKGLNFPKHFIDMLCKFPSINYFRNKNFVERICTIPEIKDNLISIKIKGQNLLFAAIDFIQDDDISEILVATNIFPLLFPKSETGRSVDLNALELAVSYKLPKTFKKILEMTRSDSGTLDALLRNHNTLYRAISMTNIPEETIHTILDLYDQIPTQASDFSKFLHSNALSNFRKMKIFLTWYLKKFPLIHQSHIKLIHLVIKNSKNDESVCEKCAIPFTFLVRRHHCRGCLDAICHNCSLTSQKLKVRICHHCKSLDL